MTIFARRGNIRVQKMPYKEPFMDQSQLICCILDIGELLLTSGAEVNRVEDTILRICNSYHFQRCDVHAINSSIILTGQLPDHPIETQLRRIYSFETNLNTVQLVNELSRYICKHSPDLPVIQREIQRIRGEKGYPSWAVYVAYGVVASSFALFFGGNMVDFVLAALSAVTMRFVSVYLQKIHINKMVESFLLSALCTAFALLCCGLLSAGHYDKIIIGNIMLLIPGLAFCNGLRDLIVGDTISGGLSLCNALLCALAIALGFVVIWMPMRILL